MAEYANGSIIEEAEIGRERPLPKIGRAPALRSLLRSWFSPSTLPLMLMGFFMAAAAVADILYPFGAAWFAAAALADRRRSFLWLIAVVCGSLLLAPELFPVYATVYLAEFFCFLLYPAPADRPKNYLIGTVFTAVLVIRGLFLVFFGISDTLLVITFAESISAAGFALILYRSFELWQRIDSVTKPGRGDVLCILLTVAAVLLGMSAVTVKGISPAGIVTVVLILFAAAQGGIGGGAAAGVILGMIPSLAAMVSPSAIGVYGFSGLTAGCFKRFRRPGISFGYLLGNILLSLYLLNTTVLTSAMAETVIAAVLFPLIPKGFVFQLKELMGCGERQGLKEPPAADAYALTRLKETCRGFEALTDVVKTVHENALPPRDKNLQTLTERISDRVCGDCSLKNVCWQEDYPQTCKLLLRIFALAEANDGLTVKDLPSDFRRKCCHHRELTAAVNCLYELYRKNEYWQEQVILSRDLALSQLRNTERILTALKTDLENRRTLKELLQKNLGRELRKKGFQVDRVAVEALGEGDLSLWLKTRHCRGQRGCGETTVKVLKALTGREYTVSACQCGKNGEGCRLCFVRKPAVTVEYSALQLIKRGSAVSGDTGAELMLNEGKEALILSDGMGSGAKAKKESEFTVALIEEVLKSGFGRDFAADLLRYRMLLNPKTDTYATVDLCLVDLIRKKAEFVKLGAGESFLCTPGQGMKVIGSRAEADAAKQPPVIEEINSGDIIIMASDGITELKENGNPAPLWLSALVKEHQYASPKELSREVIAKAESIGGLRDDCTVIVAKIV